MTGPAPRGGLPRGPQGAPRGGPHREGVVFTYKEIAFFLGESKALRV